jgi:hypothetical protein
MLPSTSSLSNYNLDTLAIFCGSCDYKSFNADYSIVENARRAPFAQLLEEMLEITKFTLRSISRRSLVEYKSTIPRKGFDQKMDSFLDSDFVLMPVIAPGGYGKSIALARYIQGFDHEKTACLFCTAELFLSMSKTENPAYGKINLNPESPGCFYRLFQDQKEQGKEQLLITIDALEELGMDDNKVKEIATTLSETILHYSMDGRLKIILSIRESTWSVIKSGFNRILGKGFIMNENQKMETGYINFPQLTIHELKEIIEYYNSKKNKTVIYDCISFEIKEKIRIPIYLHYFMNLSQKKKPVYHITAYDLEYEYLRETVFESEYPEQKEDLIWKILEIIETQSGENKIKKNSLKDHYPLHMKRETGYYLAYRELLEDILIEERIENKYGLYTTFIGFRHLNFYYYLSALNLVRKNDGISKDLFRKVIAAPYNRDWKINLISILYKFAWENEKIDALNEICKLPEEILSSLPVRFAIGTCFRRENPNLQQIAEKYARNPTFRRLYFEEFVDTNYLFNNYKFRITEYLKNAKERQSQLFGNCILFLAGFLEMNKKECLDHYADINKIDVDSSIHPWPIGRKLASSILKDKYIQKENIDSMEEHIQHFQETAYRYEGYFQQGLIAFELPVIISLVLTKNYAMMASFLGKSREVYSNHNPENEYYKLLSNNQNSLLSIFYDFSRQKMGEQNTHDLTSRIEEAINNFTTYYDDFQYLLLLRYILMDMYTSEGKTVKANLHFQAALELSRYASYDFYTAFLLLHDPEKETSNIETAKKMFRESGFHVQ